jgi:hypothetical protein
MPLVTWPVAMLHNARGIPDIRVSPTLGFGVKRIFSAAREEASLLHLPRSDNRFEIPIKAGFYELQSPCSRAHSQEPRREASPLVTRTPQVEGIADPSWLINRTPTLCLEWADWSVPVPQRSAFCFPLCCRSVDGPCVALGAQDNGGVGKYAPSVPSVPTLWNRNHGSAKIRLPCPFPVS